MENSEFEKSVQQKMGDLNIAPSDDLWEKIEAKLPAEKKPRRWLLFILLFIVFTGTSLLLWDNVVPSSDTNKKSKDRIKETLTQNKIPTQTTKLATPFVPTDESTDKDTSLKQSYPISVRKEGLPLTPYKNKRIIKPPLSQVQGDATIKKLNNVQINDNIKTRIKTIVPSAEEDVTAVDTANPASSLSTIVSIDPVPTGLPTNLNQPLKNRPDSLPENGKDSIIALAKPEPIQKKNRQNWKYGIHGGAGFSSVKAGLFSSESLFADAMVYSSPGPSGSPAVVAPNNPKGALSFSAGLSVQKKLNARWTFYTGLNYAYQSNSLKVGNTVDSAVRLYYFASRNIQSNRFYRTGNAESYKNKFHMAEIPLLMQYNVSKKWPLHLEIGGGIGYLFESNALVYNPTSRVYVTDDAMFNKFLVSFASGAGIDLAKNSRLPFSLGYRFSYSISSVTKEAYGKQHLLNSLFYLDVPLKK